MNRAHCTLSISKKVIFFLIQKSEQHKRKVIARPKKQPVLFTIPMAMSYEVSYYSSTEQIVVNVFEQPVVR